MEEESKLMEDEEELIEKKTPKTKLKIFVFVLVLAIIIIIPFVVAIYYSINSSNCIKNEEYKYRLPDSSIPLHYNLSFLILDTELPLNRYEANASIKIKILKDTKCIYLHSHKLKFLQIKFEYEYEEGKSDLLSPKFSIDEKFQFLILTFNKKVLAGNMGTLFLNYQASIPSNLETDNNAFYYVNKKKILFNSNFI